MGATDAAHDRRRIGADPLPRGRDWRRTIAGLVVIVVVAAAAGWAVYRQRHDFVSGIRTMGYWPLLSSLGAAVVAVYATFRSWREVLAGLEVRLGHRVAARVFFVSQLGKYLPGSVWPVALQMQAGSAVGARRRTMLAGNLITLALSCTVGLLVGGVSLAFSQSGVLGRYWWFGFAFLLLLPALHPRAVPQLLDSVFSLIGRERLNERLSPTATVRAIGWSLMSWLAFGVHLALLCAAFGHLSASDLAGCVAAISLAVTLGVLVIPAPAGAGVRDVVLGVVLGSVLVGPGQVLTVVVASRVVLIAADVVLAILAGVGPGVRTTQAPSAQALSTQAPSTQAPSTRGTTS